MPLSETRGCDGKDIGQGTAATMWKSRRPVFFYNAVSVKTLILGHFYSFSPTIPLIMLQPTKNSGNLFSVLKRTKPCYISELLNTILNDAYSTGELKKIGSADLYYTRQSGGKDVSRLPCALLGQSVEPFFFNNAVSVKTLILVHFWSLRKIWAGNILGGGEGSHQLSKQDPVGRDKL